MKKQKIEILREKPKEELINDLRNRRCSILRAIKCHKLRLEMFLPGIVCTIIVRLLCFIAKLKDRKEWINTIRTYFTKVLDKYAPYEIDSRDKLPINRSGLVLGFNHPSLGEILRLLDLVMKEYPNHRYLFPVNLPWYEALCPVIEKLEVAGIYITPVITPSTRQKIERTAGAKAVEKIAPITISFNGVYLNLCRDFAKTGDIILVAPSATRQQTVFNTDFELCQRKKIEPQTMSLLVQTLAKKVENCVVEFVPLAVRPPSGYKKGLNLSETYLIGVGEMFGFDEAYELTNDKYGAFRGRKFDFEFLARISRRLFSMGKHDMIAPLKSDDAINGLAELFKNRAAAI